MSPTASSSSSSKAAAQVAQLGAQIEQLLERLHLARHVLRLEVVQALEMQVDLQLWSVGFFAQLVLDREREVRFHPFEDAIEVVRVHLHKLPVAQPRERFRRLTGEITQYSHDEWEFLQFNRVADFNVVGDVHARRPNPVQLVLCTLFSHKLPLEWDGAGVSRGRNADGLYCYAQAIVGVDHARHANWVRV